MLLLCLTTKTYLSPQLLLYMPIDVLVHDLPVHLHTFIPNNHYDLSIHVSTALHVHRCTCSSVYLFSLFFPFRHNMHFCTYLSIHLLSLCWTHFRSSWSLAWEAIFFTFVFQGFWHPQYVVWVNFDCFLWNYHVSTECYIIRCDISGIVNMITRVWKHVLICTIKPPCSCSALSHDQTFTSFFKTCSFCSLGL